jgi:hypothetical protein
MPSKYQVNYTVSNAAPISLLRVFDDGGSTYFQFRSNPPEALVISAETAIGEAIIPHERRSTKPSAKRERPFLRVPAKITLARNALV